MKYERQPVSNSVRRFAAAATLASVACMPWVTRDAVHSAEAVPGVSSDMSHMQIAATLVDIDGLAPYANEPYERAIIEEGMSQIEATTNGKYAAGEISVDTLRVRPDATEHGKPCVSNDMLKSIRDRRRVNRVGGTALTMSIINTTREGAVCGSSVEQLGSNKYIGARAYQDQNAPHIDVYYQAPKSETSESVGGLATAERKNISTITHEIGHLLTHAGYGRGLSHEQMLSKPGIWAARAAQADGVVKTSTGQVDEYASWATVEGDGNAQSSNGLLDIYSPPEQMRLDPSLRVDTITNESNIYRLSDEASGLYGLKIKLSTDHPLTKINNTTSLFIGQMKQRGTDGGLITVPDGEFSYTTAVWGMSEDASSTTLLTPLSATTLSVNKWINDGKERSLDGDITPIFADDTLDMTVYAGTDGSGSYVRVGKLTNFDDSKRLHEYEKLIEERMTADS